MRLIALALMISLTGCATLGPAPSETSAKLVPKPAPWSVEKRNDVANLLAKFQDHAHKAVSLPMTLTPTQAGLTMSLIEEHLRLRFSNFDAREALAE